MSKHWSEMQGKPWGVAPNHKMLFEEGYIKDTSGVFYDRDYILAWLMTNFVDSLEGLGEQQLYDLLTEAIELSKKAKSVKIPKFYKGQACAYQTMKEISNLDLKNQLKQLQSNEQIQQ